MTLFLLKDRFSCLGMQGKIISLLEQPLQLILLCALRQREVQIIHRISKLRLYMYHSTQLEGCLDGEHSYSSCSYNFIEIL